MSTASRTNAVLRSHHLTILVAALGIVLLTCLLQVREDQRVELRMLPGYPVPQTCLTHSLFGIDCPGCGLTRSFIYLSQNDWQRSWSLHRLGWLLAAAVVLQLPYRVAALRLGTPPLGERLPRILGLALIVLLLVNWLVDLNL